MLLKIKNETIKKTTECKTNFSCFNQKIRTCCEVEQNVGGTVLFVKYTPEKKCNYMTSFGCNFICNCPTRKEIFNRYKI